MDDFDDLSDAERDELCVLLRAELIVAEAELELVRQRLGALDS